MTVGTGLVAIAIYTRIQRPSPDLKRWSAVLIALVVTQLTAGLINLLLLAPIWMQHVHLLLSDLIWIALILLAVTGQRGSRPQRNGESGGPGAERMMNFRL